MGEGLGGRDREDILRTFVPTPPGFKEKSQITGTQDNQRHLPVTMGEWYLQRASSIEYCVRMHLRNYLKCYKNYQRFYLTIYALFIYYCDKLRYYLSIRLFSFNVSAYISLIRFP